MFITDNLHVGDTLRSNEQKTKKCMKIPWRQTLFSKGQGETSRSVITIIVVDMENKNEW